MKCRSQVNPSNEYGGMIIPSDVLKMQSDLPKTVAEGNFQPHLPLASDFNQIKTMLNQK